MSLKTNFDLNFLVVAEMVRCSDVEFATFWKRKSSKKVPREAEAASGVGITPEGEAPPATPIIKVARAEVKACVDLPEVSRETVVVREPIEVPETTEVPDRVKAPVGENSLTWAMGES